MKNSRIQLLACQIQVGSTTSGAFFFLKTSRGRFSTEKIRLVMCEFEVLLKLDIRMKFFSWIFNRMQFEWNFLLKFQTNEIRMKLSFLFYIRVFIRVFSRSENNSSFFLRQKKFFFWFFKFLFCWKNTVLYSPSIFLATDMKSLTVKRLKSFAN